MWSRILVLSYLENLESSILNSPEDLLFWVSQFPMILNENKIYNYQLDGAIAYSHYLNQMHNNF